MRAAYLKDVKHRLTFLKKEYFNLRLKFILQTAQHCFFTKKKFHFFGCGVFFLQKRIQKGCRRTRMVRRCVLNNRGRGSLRSFKISRIACRDLLGQGSIPGFKKAVW